MSKALGYLSGVVISSPVLGFFTGERLSDIEKGFEGKGDATGYDRLVYKYGQVYHSGKWVNYYETYQRENYWKFETITYKPDGSLSNAKTEYYFPETFGYLPFDWIYTSDFYDNQRIIDVANYQYGVEPNRTAPTRDYYRYENYRSLWNAKGVMPY
ncbi:hypothetical protein [Paenibacillus sp. SN-8-1]|uniref:hypothetical protein n=1 Tax=Paenibacillus sp. SN-8-1 TaxID=3435409 RepID=UPI003D9AA92D